MTDSSNAAVTYHSLLKTRPSAKPVSCAVVYPCSQPAIKAALDASEQKIIRPIFVGPEDRIRSLAAKDSLPLDQVEIVNTSDNEPIAAVTANALVRDGKAQLLMKGSLHTDQLLRAVVSKTDGLLLPGHRISHVFVITMNDKARPLFITDAAINILPDVPTMAEIVQNSINLYRGLGLGTPKVAMLSAAETVNMKMPSSIDAATICKMADRGQITGAIIDGPLGMDNAINMEAAKMKGINSPVAGQADILVVPNIEAGNILVKGLSFLADALAVGVVLGARIPIVLTSRADTLASRFASCRIAAAYTQQLSDK